MDQVTICNMALSKLGEQSITTLTDGSLEARFCSLLYQPTMQELLMSNIWNFNTKLATLTQLSASPIFDWDYAYQLPADYGRMAGFNNFGTDQASPDFETQGNLLLTDEASAQIAYLSLTINESLFTPLFTAAAVSRLAADLCRALSGSTSLRETLMQEVCPALGQLSRSS
jgi:hypothetical protein